MKRGERKKLMGRHALTVGAVLLVALTGYELWVRLEDFWAWTEGVRHLSQVRGTPFLQDMAIVFEAPQMRQLGVRLVFLVCALSFGIVCLIRRNRAGGVWVLLALDLCVAAVGAFLQLYDLRHLDWLQAIKLLPMGLIMAGCVTNDVHGRRQSA